MSGAAVLMLVLYGISMTLAIVKHGEPQEPYNAVTTAIALAISWSILYWGGFWA